MADKKIDENFVLREDNLFECKFCKTTFESQNECLLHIKEQENCKLEQFRKKFETELLQDYANYLSGMLEGGDLTCVEDWYTWTEEEFEDKEKWELK